jgi:hypothetical protein
MSCSKADAHQCWTLPQFLKVTNDAEFAEYAVNNYNLDEDSTDAAKQDDSSGYADEELQEDEKEEVKDDDFFNLHNQNILEIDTAPPENDHPKKNILIWRNPTIMLTRWGLLMTKLCLMLR